jgi:anti-anti-sigma factor
MLTVKLKEVSNYCVLHLNGVLDTDTVGELLKEVGPLLQKKYPRLILDCSFVHDIDAIALAVLLDLQQRLSSENIELNYIQLTEDVLNVVMKAGVKSFIKIFPSMKELS